MRLPFLAFVALAACASPQERCVNNANRELRVINSLIAQTRANVSRGYAIEEVQEIRSVKATCDGETAEGIEFEFECERSETVTTRKAVAIDLNAEKAKLAALEERQQQMVANQAAAIAQCRAQFPEG